MLRAGAAEVAAVQLLQLSRAAAVQLLGLKVGSVCVCVCVCACVCVCVWVYVGVCVHFVGSAAARPELPVMR